MLRIASRDVIFITGPEAVHYLDGQISQAIADMAIGESRHSFCLEPQGKIEAWFRITRTDTESLVADCDPGHGEAAQQSMERFKLRTKIHFDLQQRLMVSARDGSGVEMCMSQAGIDVELSLAADWPGAGGTDLILDASATRDALGELEAASDDEWEAWRIAHGIPVVGADIPVGGIPNETGLTDMSCSFTKGCYRGQELVERIDSRGAQRLVLRRLESASGATPTGDLTNGDGDGVGSVTSAADGWALGYVRGNVDVGGTVTDAAGNTLTVHELLLG